MELTRQTSIKTNEKIDANMALTRQSSASTLKSVNQLNSKIDLLSKAHGVKMEPIFSSDKVQTLSAKALAHGVFNYTLHAHGIQPPQEVRSLDGAAGKPLIVSCC